MPAPTVKTPRWAGFLAGFALASCYAVAAMAASTTGGVAPPVGGSTAGKHLAPTTQWQCTVRFQASRIIIVPAQQVFMSAAASKATAAAQASAQCLRALNVFNYDNRYLPSLPASDCGAPTCKQFTYQ